MKLLKILFSAAFICSVFSCSADNGIESTRKPQPRSPGITYSYQKPVELGDGIETAALADVSIDSTKLYSMMNDLLNSEDHGIHSILIFKEDKLVFEEYFAGTDLYTPYQQFGPDIVHGLASVTKSFTSAMMGIAIDEGFIEGVDKKMFSFFPEYDHLNSEEKDSITLHHLLSMTSGLEWEENAYPFTDSRNDLIRFNTSTDPIGFYLAKPLLHTPGTTFKYSGGGVNVLGSIISRESGMSLESFSQQYLFDKLGINDFTWIKIQPSGLTYVSGDLHIRPRAMGKFGLLFLNNGNWKGEQVISQQWVEDSTKGHSLGDAYGYLWWRDRFPIGNESIESFYAGGWGGQFIFVMKDLGLVLVFTGGNFDTDGDTPVFTRIREDILPSIGEF